MDIEVPDLVRTGGLHVVASVSGGKDSVALCLALKEADVPHVRVFADTGWEAQETYAHLDYLRSVLGPIEVVKPKRDMVEASLYRAGFPARMQRWCTRELKLVPLRAFHDSLGGETVNAMGVRADESASRAKMAGWDDDDEWGGWCWRPLLRWSVADVLEIHRRHGVAMNPLYHHGHDRVGCYPCIFSRKDEIRIIAERSPERIDEIERLEEACTSLRAERNSESPDRYAQERATFFQTRDVGRVMGIREIVSWAKTTRGGRQLPLLAEPPSGGCMRWGMCEAPPVKP